MVQARASSLTATVTVPPGGVCSMQFFAMFSTAATFQGDAPWTAEAVENIAKNCMEHTPPGGTVTVAVSEDALACTIAVSDTGPGIAPEDLPHIFERFYRGRGGEGPDVAQPAGFGIGLSLAQALVSAQGGTLRAFNNPDGGARFEIAFPKLVV